MKIFKWFSQGNLVFFPCIPRFNMRRIKETREKMSVLWKRDFCFIPTTAVQGVYVSCPHLTDEDTESQGEAADPASPSWIRARSVQPQSLFLNQDAQVPFKMSFKEIALL